MNILLVFVLTPVNDLPVLVTKQRILTRGIFLSKPKAYIWILLKAETSFSNT